MPCQIFLSWYCYAIIQYKKFPKKDNPKYQILQAGMMLDKIITVFFIGILGTLWFFTRRYEIPHKHTIITYDMLGKQARLDGLRTSFNTRAVAVSFAKHYTALFPQYEFVLESNLPNIRRRFLVSQK